jgi:hypothetical protein
MVDVDILEAHARAADDHDPVPGPLRHASIRRRQAGIAVERAAAHQDVGTGFEMQGDDGMGGRVGAADVSTAMKVAFDVDRGAVQVDGQAVAASEINMAGAAPARGAGREEAVDPVGLPGSEPDNPTAGAADLGGEADQRRIIVGAPVPDRPELLGREFRPPLRRTWRQEGGSRRPASRSCPADSAYRVPPVGTGAEGPPSARHKQVVPRGGMEEIITTRPAYCSR